MLRKAAFAYCNKSDLDGYFQVYNKISNNLYATRNYSAAALLYDTLLYESANYLGEFDIFRARCHQNKAFCHYQTMQYWLANDHFKKSLEVYRANNSEGKHYRNIAINYRYLGQISSRMQGDAFKADRYLEASIAALDSAQGLSDQDRADLLVRLYYALGINCKLKGDYFKMVSCAYKALESVPKLTRHKDWFEESCLVLLANGYNLQRDPRAYEVYERIITLHKRRAGENSIGLVVHYNNQALSIAKQEGEEQRTKNTFWKAIHIAEESKDRKAGLYLAKALISLSSLYMNEQQTDSAIWALNKSQAIYADYYDDMATNMVELYTTKAHYFSGLGSNTDSALFYINRSIGILYKQLESSDSGPDIESGKVSDKLSYIFVLDQKANLLHKLAIKDSALIEQEKVAEVLGIYDKIDSLILSQRETYQMEDAELFFSSMVQSIYERAFQTLIFYQKRGILSSKYQNLLFSMMEHNKAQILARSLSAAEAKRGQGIGLPDSLLNLEREVNYKISKLNAGKSQAKDQAALSEIEQQLYDLDEELNRIKSIYEKQYPRYFSMKYAPPKMTLENARQYAVANQSMLIEYFVGKQSCYMVAISTDTTIFESIPLEELAGEVADFQQLLQQGYRLDHHHEDFAAYAHLGYVLFEQLIGDRLLSAAGKVKSLVIIPDGALAFLPFEALLTQKPDSATVNYQGLPYLLKKVKISYAYSLNLLEMGKGRRSGAPDLIAFGYSDEGLQLAQQRDGDLAALHGSTRELKAIQVKVGGEMFKGAEASKTAFMDKVGGHNIVHLALHGSSSLTEPLKSALHFPEGGQDSTEENGRSLFVYELYGMQLNADLSVLSACESGIGKMVSGEGVFSMGRAFAYAGCPSVVMSLWKINDRETAKLMGGFYDRIAKGLDSRESLHQIKLDYLQTADELSAHPYFWAAMIQIGPEVAFKSSWGIFSNSLVWLISLVLVGAMAWLVWQKQHTASS